MKCRKLVVSLLMFLFAVASCHAKCELCCDYVAYGHDSEEIKIPAAYWNKRGQTLEACECCVLKGHVINVTDPHVGQNAILAAVACCAEKSQAPRRFKNIINLSAESHDDQNEIAAEASCCEEKTMTPRGFENWLQNLNNNTTCLTKRF